MSIDVSVVIMAAGLGTRMRSDKPKVLHCAGGDTVLSHVLRAALRVASPDRIAVVVGHQGERVAETVKIPGVHLAFQPEQRGTGHAVLCAKPEVARSTGAVLILNGDGPLLRPPTLMRLVEDHRRASGGAIVTTHLSDPTGYGRIIR